MPHPRTELDHPGLVHHGGRAKVESAHAADVVLARAQPPGGHRCVALDWEVVDGQHFLGQGPVWQKKRIKKNAKKIRIKLNFTIR